MHTYLFSLLIQAAGTVLLFVVFLLLYRKFRRPAFLDWIASWAFFLTGLGLLWMVMSPIGKDSRLALWRCSRQCRARVIPPARLWRYGAVRGASPFEMLGRSRSWRRLVALGRPDGTRRGWPLRLLPAVGAYRHGRRLRGEPGSAEAAPLRRRYCSGASSARGGASYLQHGEVLPSRRCCRTPISSKCSSR